MGEALSCTLKDRDEKGVGRCSCSLVVATGGECPFGPPLLSFYEAFPYLTATEDGAR